MAERIPALMRAALIAVVGMSLISRTTPAQLSIVIRRPDIERAGWNRVSELLEGATGWGRSSVDGFTFAASLDRLPPPGLSRPGTAQWIVFVDGQPMTTDLFGLQLLELLPVSVADIDSMTLTSGPTIVNGRPNARGVMRVFTRRATAGASGALTYQHGDESGDPGPFRYTALSSPNLEKLGPFAHASVSYGAPRLDVIAGVHYASLNVTDTLITSRFPGIFERLPQDVIAVTPTFRAVARAHGTHELLASFGAQRGLMYIPTQAREQSLNTKLGNVSVGGRIDSLGAVTFAYSGGFQSLVVDELDSPLAFTVGHERRHGYGSVQMERASGRMTMGGGVGADAWSATRDGRKFTATAPRAFASLAVSFSKAELDLAGSVAKDHDVVEPNGEARIPIRLDSLTRLTFRAASVANNSGADGTWIDALVLTPVVGRGYTTDARRLRATAVGATLARRMAWLEASVGSRVDRISIRDRTTTGAAEQTAATLVGFTAHAAVVDGGVVTGGLDLSHEMFVTGDPTLRARGDAVPATEMRATISATPGEDFRMSGAIDLVGSSRWPFPAPADTVRALDAIARFDGSVEKWMWKRRIRLEVVARNLLNRPERYHPQGAQWNLRSHISLSLRLP